MLLVQLLLPASAAPFPLETVHSPFGALDVREARLLCAADRVFVGTVMAARTWFERGDARLSPFPRGAMVSDTTFVVEVDLRGSGGTFDLVLPGGRWGAISGESDHFPYPGVGRRYLLAFRSGPYPASGGWILMHWRTWPPPGEPGLPLPGPGALDVFCALG